MGAVNLGAGSAVAIIAAVICAIIVFYYAFGWAAGLLAGILGILLALGIAALAAWITWLVVMRIAGAAKS